MHVEFEFIINLALKNGYPSRFIYSQIRKILNRHFERSKKEKPIIIQSKNIKKDSQQNEQSFINLPYFGNATSALGKKIIKLAKNSRPDIHAQPIYRPPPAITTFFSQKDKLQKDFQSNIVYMICCSECDESYIGKIIRQASRRHHEYGAPKQPKTSSITRTKESNCNTEQLRRSDRINSKLRTEPFIKEQNQDNKTQSLKSEHLKRSALFEH